MPDPLGLLEVSFLTKLLAALKQSARFGCVAGFDGLHCLFELLDFLLIRVIGKTRVQRLQIIVPGFLHIRQAPAGHELGAARVQGIHAQRPKRPDDNSDAQNEQRQQNPDAIEKAGNGTERLAALKLCPQQLAHEGRRPGRGFQFKGPLVFIDCLAGSRADDRQ